ncbi:MAG: CCA tRNA nucleotidyltransferase [bacterium]
MKKATRIERTAMPDALSRLENESLTFLRRLGEIAEVQGMRVYLVGGPVRDLLLGAPTSDWDVVIEGSGLDFARAVADEFGAMIQEFPQFQTAKLFFKDGASLDVATSREEIYARPGALPKVKAADLQADLFRRDFTMNALAVALNPGEFGALADFFGGYRDLVGKRIRVLHDRSFVEDPTRIFRAVRYEQRLGFRCEPKTSRLLQAALKSGVLKKLSGDRVRNEILKMMKEPDPGKCLAHLNAIGAWRAFDVKYAIHPAWFAPKSGVPAAVAAFNGAKDIDLRVAYLMLLLAGFSQRKRATMTQYLHLERHFQKGAVQLSRDTTRLEKLLKCTKPSKYHRVLSPLPAEYIMYLWVRYPEIRKPIQTYWNRWRGIRLTVSGADLKDAGIPEGPEMGKIMRTLLAMKLDGLLLEKDELKTAVQLHGN